MPRRYAAFIDESGQRSSTAKSSDCFVLTAVLFLRRHKPDCEALLSGLRKELGRRAGDPLSWKNIKTHSQRLHVAKRLDAAEWLRVSSVVVCKRMFSDGQRLPDEDKTYLYTLRYLLERISWLARDDGATISYMLAHIVRFKMAKLREYENRLRGMTTNIAWPSIEGGGAVDQPHRVEMLQLADLAASATGAAFNLDQFGSAEIRYLKEISPRLYRRGSGSISSYGMKMHPWNDGSKKAYSWVDSI